MKLNVRAMSIALALSSMMVLVGCGKDDAQNAPAGKANAQQKAPATKMPPAVVDVQEVSLGHVPVIKSFSGRVVAFETSKVLPQAGGIIDEVLFHEGTYVKKGQPLYRINHDNYVSSANSSLAMIQTAEANLASAKAGLVAQEAQLAQARADLDRVESLIKIDAISRQMYDQYVTAYKTANANVQVAKASVEQAHANINNAKASHDASRLNISRTIIKAPISGKIGISAVTAGTLVSANQTTPLATISRTDMVYVDISQSSSELLKLRQQFAEGKAFEGSPQVQITLEDGSVYPIIGELALSDAHVDETTGSVIVRAIFPNPDGVLIPGMYVNAKVAQAVANNAILLPQSAIIRTPKGQTQVYIVNQQKKIEIRDVKTIGTQNGQWIVNEGLKDGDVVVVMGGAKVKPDQEVQTRALVSVGTQDAGAPASQSQSNVPTSQGQNSVMASTDSQQPKDSTQSTPKEKDTSAPKTDADNTKEKQ